MKGKSKDSIAPFISEINIIEQLRHHNIAKYLVSRDSFYFILSFFIYLFQILEILIVVQGHRFTKNSDRIWLFLEYCPFSLEV